MIRSISIQGIKSFPRDSAHSFVIDNTKRVSLFYGLNGAGKSAIAEVIHRNGNKQDPLPHCAIELTREDRYQYLVYNESFVEHNFRGKADFPGIFTIGERDSSALQEEEEKQRELAELITRQTQLAEDERKLNAAKDASLKAAYDATWRIYTEHSDGPLRGCTKGFGGAKQKVFDTVSAVNLEAEENLPSLDDLKSRVQDLEAADASEKPYVGLSADGFSQIEGRPIWGVPIVGSTESRLAPLIESLGSLDWVGHGRQYLKDDLCPFCQQGLPHDFRDQLTILIDGVYQQKLDEVSQLAAQYGQRVAALGVAYEGLLSKESFAQEHSGLKQKWAELNLVLSKNLAQMHQKLKYPSEPIVIEDSAPATALLSAELLDINGRIEVYNRRIKNRREELQKLNTDFWKRMRYDYAGALDIYAASNQNYRSEMDGLTSEVSSIRERRAILDARLVELRARNVGTDKAVDAINSRLKRLGVRSFQIKKKDGDRNLYCLERPGMGPDLYSSLSEGEKTLITFFYFVELVSGSLDEAESFAHDKKIVVIDDPISSLSHNYVYDIASVIAHEIVDGEHEGKKIRQIMLLTHSLFFFHELQRQIKPIKACQFFRVVKKSHSAVVAMKGDEIKNEYVAFWQVIRDARDGLTNAVSVPNAMRCILEHFFSFTQQLSDLERSLKELENEDHTFVPLARYLNRKSHADQINITDFTDHDIDYYIEKLKGVFTKTRHPEHYALMMDEVGDPV